MGKSKFKSSQIFGNWVLIECIGRGGNGEVWKCKNAEGKLAAIKILIKVKSKAYKRFLDEIKVIEANKDLDGIIPILDKNTPKDLEKDIPYFVMELAKSSENTLQGADLKDKIKAIQDVGSVLEILHSRGISHRDIKPANILFFNEKYVLADFGLVNYPDKENISENGETIGAKWTMAPEMKRESHKADGIKADIYSLAKTLWIILMDSPKGFDGQYSSGSILDISTKYTKDYLSPINNLLIQSTENDPNMRPTISIFLEKIRGWEDLNSNFHESNNEQWLEVQSKLFPCNFPKRVVWEDVDDIINVLKVVSSFDNLTHMFYPEHGGMDLEDVRHSHEEGCIELDFQLIDIVKPKRLIFESFNDKVHWNYFRLELDELESSGVYEKINDDPNYMKDAYSEDLSELSTLKYDDYSILEDVSYSREQGYEISDNARQLSRWFKGSFVIFNKRSAYNLTTSTYDGRHNKMGTDEFRDYIQRQIDINKLK